MLDGDRRIDKIIPPRELKPWIVVIPIRHDQGFESRPGIGGQWRRVGEIFHTIQPSVRIGIDPDPGDRDIGLLFGSEVCLHPGGISLRDHSRTAHDSAVGAHGYGAVLTHRDVVERPRGSRLYPGPSSLVASSPCFPPAM